MMMRFTKAFLGMLTIAALSASVAYAEPAAKATDTASSPTQLALNTDPVQFPDCMANGQDCCHVTCKAAIDACCVANSCGLPVNAVVNGKGPFKGLSGRCSDIAPTQVFFPSSSGSEQPVFVVK